MFLGVLIPTAAAVVIVSSRASDMTGPFLDGPLSIATVLLLFRVLVANAVVFQLLAPVPIFLYHHQQRQHVLYQHHFQQRVHPLSPSPARSSPLSIAHTLFNSRTRVLIALVRKDALLLLMTSLRQGVVVVADP